MQKINNAIVGHTGFIGTELKKIIKRPKCFSSKNINRLYHYDIKNLFIAAPSSIKFAALQNIEFDLNSIKTLILILNKTKIKKIYLFGTIDAVNFENVTNENSKTNLISCNSYGFYRGLFEKFCLNNFDTTVLRLPVIFNNDIKKNFLFDIRRKNFNFLPNPNSKLQFYNIDNLKEDLKIIKKKKIKKINLVSQPIKIDEIYKRYLKKKIKFENKSIITHNLNSIHSKYWGNKNFLYSKRKIFNDLDIFFKKD